ncbi:MAG: MBL fold metallo-hydrolase [Desulfococcaceae bacterium]|jgi:7,8-dihydropterin-6-yl-methyl-4-(beta-D-ribofuranosyl)aminobenzene 5'-phosphate synthase|nr:MBL fold metallo-hydrolase [Desulfococcaceae bacterium]
MKTRLTILCENSVGLPFKVVGEHGFACYLENEKGCWLFDTGQGFGIIQNSLALKKDLRKIESVLISHGHYDHTGGLPAVLGMRGECEVYGHPAMFTERYILFQGIKRDIGIPFRRSFLESLGADFRLHTGMTEVGPGIFLTGEIPRKTDFEKGDANMTACMPDGKIVQPDPIPDDLSLIVNSDKGLILVLGCAHAGLVNILNYVTEQTGQDRIYAVIGGTHLGFCSETQFTETVNALNHYGVERIGVSHCTGLQNAARLRSLMQDRFFFGCVGAVLEG